MSDWSAFLASDIGLAAMAIGTGIGAALGAAWTAYKGVTQGRPTSPAVAHAVASANCRIMDMEPQIKALAADLSALTAAVARIERDLDAQRETLIRIEDRTRGR